MCLTTKSISPSIAEEDIVVYKVLFHEYYRSKKFYAPDVTSYGDSYIYKKGLNKARGKETICKSISRSDHYDIDKGFLHAFTNYDIAHKKAKYLNFVGGYDYKIGTATFPDFFVTKMIIPKGTEYYVGNNDDICAKILKWNNIEDRTYV